MKTFDFPHYGEVKRTKRSLDRVIEYESGSFQTQRVGVNPIITFEATYQGSKEFMADIEAFWDEHRKTEKFKYIYDGVEYVCKFTSDYNPTDTWGWSENGKIIAKVSSSLSMRVCNI